MGASVRHAAPVFYNLRDETTLEGLVLEISRGYPNRWDLVFCRENRDFSHNFSFYPFVAPKKVKKQIVKVILQVDSQVNMDDPDVQQALLQQVSPDLKSWKSEQNIFWLIIMFLNSVFEFWSYSLTNNNNKHYYITVYSCGQLMIHAIISEFSLLI